MASSMIATTARWRPTRSNKTPTATVSAIFVMVISTRIVGRRLRRFSREFQDALARAGEVAEETISGIRTVRSFAREGAESQRYDTAIEDSYRIAKRRVLNVSVYSGVVSFTGYSSIALVLWYGGRLVLEGAMSVGDLTSFILYNQT